MLQRRSCSCWCWSSRLEQASLSVLPSSLRLYARDARSLARAASTLLACAMPWWMIADNESSLSGWTEERDDHKRRGGGAAEEGQLSADWYTRQGRQRTVEALQLVPCCNQFMNKLVLPLVKQTCCNRSLP